MLIHDAVLNPGSAYERQFAGQIGAVHAIAFGYARTALRGILSALGLRPGDRVVLSPLTCKVVPLTLLSLRLTPVYADISPDTLNLRPECLRTAAPGAAAILFQHTYGIAEGLAEAARFARDRGIPLIEDRAQCLPYAPDPILGVAAIYSNNLLKPLPAASGGVAVTNDRTMAAELGRIAAGLPRPGTGATARLRAEAWIQRSLLTPESYWPALKLYGRMNAGYRERPVAEEITSEITSAMTVPSDYQLREGTRWLARAGSWAAQRLACCDHYRGALAGVSLTPPAAETRQPLYYFPVRSPHKQAILAEASRRRIELIAWPRTTPIYPVDSESQLRAYGFDPATCPVATDAARELIGLPTHDRMTAPRRLKAIDLLRSFS